MAGAEARLLQDEVSALLIAITAALLFWWFYGLTKGLMFGGIIFFVAQPIYILEYVKAKHREK